MKKKVNDIFYSLQGEGFNTGRAALFVRFAGCNLRCPWCDTDFESYHEWSDDYIVTELLAHCIDHGVLYGQKPMVVLTGGEPTLQVDEAFVDLLHQEGFYVAMESNGLLPAPGNLDWLTVSPKSPRPLGPRRRLRSMSEQEPTTEGEAVSGKRPDEIKIVFDGETDPETILADYKKRVGFGEEWKPLLYLQPCDVNDAVQNGFILSRCVRYVMLHPQWQLSLQTHKMIGIM